MYKLDIILIIVLFLVGCGRPPLDTPAENRLVADSLINEHLDSVYKFANRFPNNTQIAVGLIQNGKPYFYGVIRYNDTLFTTQNSDSAFEIGSLTKVFTATILANYVVNGEINPDNKINPVFQFQFNNNIQFSYKELANHTSGLPRLPSNLRFTAIFNQDNPYKGYDHQKFDKYLKNNMKLNYPKGSKSEYSNLGMGLLSYTLQKYSGKNFEELLNAFVFSKYQMFNSSTVKSNVSDILVVGQNAKGEPTSNWASGALIGAGGIYSTVSDLSKFAIAQFDSANKELALTRVKTFKETDTRDVGLGWFIIHRKNGDQWYWHNGGTGGYTSSMVIDVENKNGIIILTNLSGQAKLLGDKNKIFILAQ